MVVLSFDSYIKAALVWWWLEACFSCLIYKDWFCFHKIHPSGQCQNAKFICDPALFFSFSDPYLLMITLLKVNSIFLMKHILLWGPWRRHLHTGLISLRELRPLTEGTAPGQATFRPHWSFHQHPALNELENGGQREERKKGRGGETTNVGPLYTVSLMKVALLSHIGQSRRYSHTQLCDKWSGSELFLPFVRSFSSHANSV